MIHTKENLPAIGKGDVLLVKVLHDGSEVSEWYLGQAMRSMKKVKRRRGASQMVEVWWRYPFYRDSSEAVPPNELNARFKLWYIAKEEAEISGAKNQKNLEWVDRAAVAMIGVDIVGSGNNKGMIKYAHKREIASLNIGFELDRGTKRLRYVSNELGV